MDIWMIVIDAVLGFVLAVLAFLLQQKIKENEKLKKEQKDTQCKRDKALENGVVCILRKHLMDEHSKWMVEKYITTTALESFLLMYAAYKGLGGNGMIDHMEEEVRDLPVRD